jgi:hypothetical protein
MMVSVCDKSDAAPNLDWPGFLWATRRPSFLYPSGELRNQSTKHARRQRPSRFSQHGRLEAHAYTRLSLYWGVLYRVDANMRPRGVYVVDFDGQVAPYTDVTPLVGPQVVQLAQRLVDHPGPELGCTVLPPSQFNNDTIAVRRAIYNFECWLAIIVDSNATALLQNAVAAGNASYSRMYKSLWKSSRPRSVQCGLKWSWQIRRWTAVLLRVRRPHLILEWLRPLLIS